LFEVYVYFGPGAGASEAVQPIQSALADALGDPFMLQGYRHRN
jgi:hypothetical protein